MRELCQSEAACKEAWAMEEEDKEDEKEAVVQHLVREDFGPLRNASSQLRGDPDFMLELGTLNPEALRFASPQLLNSKDFVLQAVAEFPFALALASDELRADRDVVLRAMRTNCWASEFARIRKMCRQDDFCSALSSHLACPGDRAPIFSTAVKPSFKEKELEVVGTLLSGQQVQKRLGWEATVEDLASALFVYLGLSEDLNKEPNEGSAQEASYIHIVLEGMTKPLSPFDADKPLISFLGVGLGGPSLAF